MRIVALAEAKDALSAFVKAAQQDRVLITRHGRPAAILIGVEGEDFEDLITQASPKFWQMIEKRRKNTRTLSSAEMRKSLGIRRSKKKRSRR